MRGPCSKQTRLPTALSRMMGHMDFCPWVGANRNLQAVLFFIFLGVNSSPALAQADYTVQFEMEKPQYLLGEPIFCRFVIRNTGSKVFAFRYRTPTRTLGTDYDQEPRFHVTDFRGRPLPDPGRKPCGNPQGTAVYGSVTLPPGQVHAERWLLNQWAVFTAPGRYHVRAERRLALHGPGQQAGDLSEKALAFALAIDELSFEVIPSTREQIEAAYKPSLAAVKNPKEPDPSEAVVVLTSLPQPFFFDQLSAMANAGHPDRWDRRDVMDGLARLNTPASWQEILKRFRDSQSPPPSRDEKAPAQAEDPLRSYAMLLLAEKSDPAFIPAFLVVLKDSPEPMRGDILRTLGFFHDPRASQVLFDNLHSRQVTDRMNAILGLKTFGGKEVIPALIAALDDPELQVRQVANFALEGLSGHKVSDELPASELDAQRLAEGWHAWWLQSAATYSPPKPAPCHDW